MHDYLSLESFKLFGQKHCFPSLLNSEFKGQILHMSVYFLHYKQLSWQTGIGTHLKGYFRDTWKPLLHSQSPSVCKVEFPSHSS